MPESPTLSGESHHTSRWGTACLQCAQAKAKCLRIDPEAGSRCDRCHRLNKDCSEKTRKKRRQRLPKPSRTSQIEDRLNTLIESLQASKALTSPSPDTTSPAAQSNPSLFPPSSEIPSMASHAPGYQGQDASLPHLPQVSISSGPTWIPDTYNCHAPQLCICRPAAGEVMEVDDSDEELLDIYKKTLLRVYPFVVIPDQVTAKELQATRPFLMACIRMVSCFRSLRSIQSQMFRLMSRVSEHVLMRSERSLDLLSGIVVMLGWYHNHCLVHSQMHNLLSLATTMAAELGLKRNPSWQERTELMVVHLGEAKPRTNEERRLILAVWFLSSCISTEFQKLDPLKFSPHMKQCLRGLELAPEYESDLFLVQLIRAQDLSDRIMQLKLLDETELGSHGAAKAPLSSYMRAFLVELEELRSSMPPHLRDNYLLKIRLNTISLRLNEPPRTDFNLITSLSKSLTVTPSIPGQSSPLDWLYRTKEVLQAWFNEFFSFSVSEYYSLPLPVVLDITYAMTILGRWAKLVTPGLARPVNNLVPVDPSGFYNAGASETSILGSEGSNASASGERDRRIAEAITKLRKQLGMQPGLNLDVTGLLNTLGSKMEQAHSVLASRGKDPQAWERSAWVLGAIKIRIMQVKVGEWTEMLYDNQENGKAPINASKSGSKDSGALGTDGHSIDIESWTNNILDSLPLLEDTYEGIDFFSMQMDQNQDWGPAMMF